MRETVRWAGVDVVVELGPVERLDKSGIVDGLLRGTFGEPPITVDRSTRRIDDAVHWDAQIVCPVDMGGEGDNGRVRGLGFTAQAALDGLAEQLRDVANWAYSALHPGQEELHYAADPRDGTACSAIGHMRYTSDLELFESLIGIVPTCEECVEHRHDDQEDEE